MAAQQNKLHQSAKITLGSKKEVTPFNSLTIVQSINHHHTFEVTCYHTVFESKDADLISATKDIVGESITIVLSRQGSQKENIFKGIVTEISMDHNEESRHVVILKGYSTTILLESGPKLKSFENMSVGDLVSSFKMPSELAFKRGSIKFSEPINYIAQFNESDFRFLQRLAAIHGDWFYYDGTTLHYGETSALKTAKLIHQKDLYSLNMSMGAAPLKFKSYRYNSGFDKGEPEVIKGQNPGSIPGADLFGSKMHSKSNQIFPDSSNFMPRQVANTKSGLENFSNSYHNSIAAGLVNITGSGDNMETALANIVEISSINAKGKETSMGKFLITSITHHADGMGSYSNNFTGIPSSLKTLPNPYFEKPTADFELAKVVDNADPEKHGRVRVKFMWMQDGEQTYWIPTTQLYGGESQFKNKGTVFIPEIDDDVIVGFERGDCDQPYVSQSIMNKKAIDIPEAEFSKNLRKQICTRDGGLIFIDKGDSEYPVGVALDLWAGDDAPKAQLLMKDESGKTTIGLQAIDEITIKTNGDEVKIIMNKDGSIKVTGKNINIEAEETLTLKAKDIKMEATQHIKSKANMNQTTEAGGNMEFKATGNFKAEANANIELKGGINANLEAGVQVTAKGAMAELNGSGMTTVKGGIVMIN